MSACARPEPPQTIFLPAPVATPPAPLPPAPPPPPRGICVQLEASPRVNLYDGEAHAVVVYLLPLRSTAGFREAEPAELLSGDEIPGQSGAASDLTLLPREVRQIREPVQEGTQYVGVVADFSRGPRRAAVALGCARDGRPRRVSILSGEIEVEGERDE